MRKSQSELKELLAMNKKGKEIALISEGDRGLLLKGMNDYQCMTIAEVFDF